MKLVGIGWWKVLDGATIPVSSRSIAWCWEKADGSCICWCITGPPIRGWDQPDIVSVKNRDIFIKFFKSNTNSPHLVQLVKQAKTIVTEYANMFHLVTCRTICECLLHFSHRLTGGTAHSKRPDATLSNWWGVAGGQHGVVDRASLPDTGQALGSNGRGHFAVLLVGATCFCLDKSRSHRRCAKRWGCPGRHGGHWRLT